MKKIIIFDMDGVLVDSIDIAYQLQLDNFPDMKKDDFLELLTGNYHAKMKAYKQIHVTQELTPEEKEKRREYYAEAKLKSPIFEGVQELLKNFHELGYILVLNSSAFVRNCVPILEKAEISEYFDMIATAEISKSKVEKFEIIEKNIMSQKMI